MKSVALMLMWFNIGATVAVLWESQVGGLQLTDGPLGFILGGWTVTAFFWLMTAIMGEM